MARLYDRVCPRCLEMHKTTVKSSKAICENCNKTNIKKNGKQTNTR